MVNHLVGFIILFTGKEKHTQRTPRNQSKKLLSCDGCSRNITLIIQIKPLPSLHLQIKVFHLLQWLYNLVQKLVLLLFYANALLQKISCQYRIAHLFYKSAVTDDTENQYPSFKMYNTYFAKVGTLLSCFFVFEVFRF